MTGAEIAGAGLRELLDFAPVLIAVLLILLLGLAMIQQVSSFVLISTLELVARIIWEMSPSILARSSEIMISLSGANIERWDKPTFSICFTLVDPVTLMYMSRSSRSHRLLPYIIFNGAGRVPGIEEDRVMKRLLLYR